MIEKHPDNITPVEVLRIRKSQIDKYINRLTRAGSTSGDFYDFYLRQSLMFDNAIKVLQQNETTADI